MFKASCRSRQPHASTWGREGLIYAARLLKSHLWYDERTLLFEMNDPSCFALSTFADGSAIPRHRKTTGA
jgi:hypothetical protein